MLSGAPFPWAVPAVSPFAPARPRDALAEGPLPTRQTVQPCHSRPGPAPARRRRACVHARASCMMYLAISSLSAASLFSSSSFLSGCPDDRCLSIFILFLMLSSVTSLTIPCISFFMQVPACRRRAWKKKKQQGALAGSLRAPHGGAHNMLVFILCRPTNGGHLWQAGKAIPAASGTACVIPRLCPRTHGAPRRRPAARPS